jgi:hypothetical protein
LKNPVTVTTQDKLKDYLKYLLGVDNVVIESSIELGVKSLD